MTDLEKIELAIRKIATRAPTAFGFWFNELANQIAEDEQVRRETPPWEKLG